MLAALDRLRRDPLALTITVLTLTLCAIIALDLIPVLRGPASEWAWDHAKRLDLVPAFLILPIFAAGLIAGWEWWTRRYPVLRWWMLLALAVLALVFRLSVQMTGTQGLQILSRTLNPAYFGYYPPATEVENAGAFIRTYADPEVHAALDYRQQSHPPGNTLFYWAILRSTQALPFLSSIATLIIEPRLDSLPEWAQAYDVSEIVAGGIASLMVPLLSALTVLPLYALTRRLGGVEAARLAVMIYAFVPALTLFTPVIDDVFTLLTASALWLLVAGVEDRRRVRIVLAGLLCGVGLFMSFSNLPIPVIGVLFVLFYYLARREILWPDGVIHAALFAASTLVVWALVWLVFGLSPIAVYQNAIQSHATLGRSYWLWLLYNPWDILLFAGVPVAFHFVRALIGLRRRFTGPDASGSYLLLAIGVTLVTLFISGSVRGETARILLWITPLLVWAAARDITWIRARPQGYGALVCGLLALQTVVFSAALAVYH
jgi:hypothetical protein